MSINHPEMSTVETARLASCSGLSSASTQLPVSTTINTILPSISIAHPAPPIPAYSPRPPHAAIDIEFPATSNQHSLSLPAPSPSIVIDNSHLDPDLVTYAQTHDRHEGDAVVVRRLPESFPSDMASLRSSQPPESLPPYGVNDPPPYRRRVENLQREPDTLAMVFFKSGFLFPAFWVFGALMLVTPLRSPNPFDPQAALSHLSGWPPRTTEFIAWCSENIRTEEDKAEYLAKMHAAEVKWAKRCLLALVLLVCFVVAIGATIFAVVRVQK